MADVRVVFLIKTPQYKNEPSKLAITHAISYQTLDIILNDGDTVTPSLCFVGEGVLGLHKNQKSAEVYDLTSSETHIKNALLSDIDVYVCKEDLEKFGIPEDALADAKDMGAEKKINVAPFSEIQKIIDDARHLLLF
ncbi:MAG: DsrE family protein [Nitrospiraceae bacterium]|nr:DsrE family protein [Nitrospiraceae bacterium]